MSARRPVAGALLAVGIAVLTAGCVIPPSPPFDPFVQPAGEVVLAFTVASDMRDYTGVSRRHFRGAAERLADGGPGAFMISAGDIDPPQRVLETLHTYIGPDYGWFPAVGNHEAETPQDMEFLRTFDPGGPYEPANFAPGPPGSEATTYSFDAGGVHFVIINQYYDGSSDVGTEGMVSDPLLAWLENDLAASTAEITFVIGHEPAYVLPDADSGRTRHEGDSLDQYPENRDRFWAALESAGVTAYICGHTHNHSVDRFGTVWQVDSGHARGLGDTGAPSTFLLFYVMADGSLWLHPYRMDDQSYSYELSTPVKLR